MNFVMAAFTESDEIFRPVAAAFAFRRNMVIMFDRIVAENAFSFLQIFDIFRSILEAFESAVLKINTLYSVVFSFHKSKFVAFY